MNQLGPEPTIDPTSRVTQSEVGGWTWLGPRTTITESTFGDYSYTAGDVAILYTDVGKFCSIASHVRLNPPNHPMWRVTQHHATYRRVAYGFGAEDEKTFFDWRREQRVTIGHDVWIGHSATVMPGVTVGTGAVIGAGAVVTKDVAPYSVVVGVPARPIRNRFPREVAERLLEIAWWHWSREELETRFHDLSNLDIFLERYR
ncbi:MAG: DapH/DapD/GlmU-related protein [Chloroflexota bacterium]